MESLVSNLPKIWKLEDNVVGADLGQDTFQLNFAEEADLQGVLQNGPYHFDGGMISLVKWEPIISSTYPSVINFWVKVTGISMHLWEVATLEAIGKKIGTIRDIDEESGSICVTVNGFNPLLFKMIVPFASGDEVIISLEYEKLNGVCENRSRLTHDLGVCPELNKPAGDQSFEAQPDKRGVQRQQGLEKQGGFHNEGGWEKPRKYVKRALDFQTHDSSAGAGSSGSYQQNRNHGSQLGYYGGKRGSLFATGKQTGQVPPFQLNRKGSGSVWPKPLYRAKHDSKDKSVQEVVGDGLAGSDFGESQRDTGMEVSPQHKTDKALVGSDFDEATDDLLEDGECPDGSLQEEGDATAGKVTDSLVGMGSGGSDLAAVNIQGEKHKQKVMGKLGTKVTDGNPPGGGRPIKKGTVALPKPPAQT